MARSARAAATVSTPSAPAPITPAAIATAAAGAGTPGAPAAGPSRRSTRRSLAAAAASPATSSTRSTPAAAGASGTPTAAHPDPTPASVSGSSTRHAHHTKTHVEPKAHGLRNSVYARELNPCPFPAAHGGSTACGVAPDDEADDVLMAICSACAALGNLALSPDELASIAFEHGWLRPPSIAVAPATMIQNALRMHLSRCSKAAPPRKPLLTKHQLAGSTAEAVLAPALHPDAFDGPTRPKGPVWYLSPDVGRAKWRNPFAGIVVPKAPARKPAPKPPKATAARPKSDAKPSSSGSTRTHKRHTSNEPPTCRRTASPAPGPAAASAAALPRIKLRMPPADASDTTPSTPGDESDLDLASRITSRSMTVDSLSDQAAPQLPTLLPPPLLVSSTPVRRQRRRKQNVLDSSDSDTSDSDDDDSILVAKPRQPRRIVLPPSAAGAGAARIPPPPPRPATTPLGALFFSPLTTGPLPLPPLMQASPFPHHSLDNTIWAARSNTAHPAHLAFEASSSSSDDDLCDDWGTSSGLMIKGDDDELLPWPQQEEEDAKLRAATTAMRELFPNDGPTAPATKYGSSPAFNQLDNNRAPTGSDSSSMNDTASTLNAVFQGKLKNAACPAVLPQWTLSSPVSSPCLVDRSLPTAGETSPTQYLSRVAREYAADRSGMDMDVDVAVDEAWLDESGALPVHAEDSFSDVDGGPGPYCEFTNKLALGVGDLPTPECERRLQTAVWAQETAQSTMLLVKQEPEDYYPSPAATASTEHDHDHEDDHDHDHEDDHEHDADASSPYAHETESRESTTSAQSPSFGSELTLYEYSDTDPDPAPDCHLVGPESIGMEELDDWLPCAKADRTPLRGRRAARDPARYASGTWCGIGVVPPPLPVPKGTPPPLVRKRSLRSVSRRNNRSTPRKDASARLPPTPTPAEPPELELGADTDFVLSLGAPSSPSAPAVVDIDIEAEDAIGADELEAARVEAEAHEEEYRTARRAEAEENRRRWQACRRAFADAVATTAAASGNSSSSPPLTPAVSGLDTGCAGHTTPWLDSSMWSSTDSVADLVVTPSCLSPLALQITPMANTELMSLDPKALLVATSTSGAGPQGMATEGMLSQADIDAANAILPVPQAQAQRQPPQPQPQLQPQTIPPPPIPASQPQRSISTSPKLSTSPKIGKRPIAPRGEPKKIAPKQILPRLDPAHIAPKALAPAQVPAQAHPHVHCAPAPAPTSAPVVTPAPATTPGPMSVSPRIPAPAPAPRAVAGPTPDAPMSQSLPAPVPRSAPAPLAAPVSLPASAPPAPTPVAVQPAPTPAAAASPVPPAPVATGVKDSAPVAAPAWTPAALAAPTPKPANIAPAIVPTRQPQPQASAPVQVQAPVPDPTPNPARASAPAARTAVASAPAPPTTSAPAAAPAPRTVPPVGRSASASPVTTTSSAPSSNSSTAASRSSTPSSSGGTTKRLLPGIDACVIDNLPCYSHVYELPNGKKCTVLRRLDTDFVNGTALLTAIGVGADKQLEILQAPSPTIGSHRSVPLISPQGQQHAAGVPGVWIPLVTARDLARKLGLPDNKLLANILREDLFQLFKELAGISLRHTTSTEFGVPFVTQPHNRKPGQPPPRPGQHRAVPLPQGACAAGKGPLVRAPVAPPEGAPHAKRRRSTVGMQAAAATAAAAAAVRPAAAPAGPAGVRPVGRPGAPGTMPPASVQRPPGAVPVPVPAVVTTATATATGVRPGAVPVAAAGVPRPAAVRRTRASIGAK